MTRRYQPRFPPPTPSCPNEVFNPQNVGGKLCPRRHVPSWRLGFLTSFAAGAVALKRLTRKRAWLATLSSVRTGRSSGPTPAQRKRKQVRACANTIPSAYWLTYFRPYGVLTRSSIAQVRVRANCISPSFICLFWTLYSLQYGWEFNGNLHTIYFDTHLDF